MRTTLDIDDDLLQSAKELAAVGHKTTGQVVSELMRRALEPARAGRVRNGVPLLPRRAAGAPRPTMKLVNSLRDDP
ncbi:MAG TPA: type II toxin-antitoxin system VapB family antitoxin [Vicinamibacterales bacterium]